MALIIKPENCYFEISGEKLYKLLEISGVAKNIWIYLQLYVNLGKGQADPISIADLKKHEIAEFLKIEDIKEIEEGLKSLVEVGLLEVYKFKDSYNLTGAYKIVTIDNYLDF